MPAASTSSGRPVGFGDGRGRTRRTPQAVSPVGLRHLQLRPDSTIGLLDIAVAGGTSSHIALSCGHTEPLWELTGLYAFIEVARVRMPQPENWALGSTWCAVIASCTCFLCWLGHEMHSRN